MNKLRLAVIVSLATLPTAAITLVACSSDSVVNVSTDSGPPDVFVPTDSGGDAQPTDAGADAFDGGFVQQTYDTTIATAMCLYLSRCCYGTTSPGDGGIDSGADGGGTFDLNACIATYKPLGYDFSNVDITVADPNAITIDQTLSKQCVDGINAASCNPLASDFRALRTKCFGAVKGKKAAGDSCKYSIECQDGNFCKPTDPSQFAGSAGTCTALRAAGDTCADTFMFDDANHKNADEEACSTRASGDTNRFCQYQDGAGNDLPRDQWKCEDSRINGSTCQLDSWCSQGICNPGTLPDPTCVDTLPFFNSFNCGQFVK